jgi:hypothetical protein
MALVLNDRVKETTTTTGTGTVNLGGAETGFETFVAGVGDGNTTYYCITAGAEFEVGLGTVTDASPDTLSRTTILSSSNSDSAVDFSAGTKDVFCTLPASKAVFEDASSNVTLPGTLDVDGGITVDNITIDGTEIDLSSGDLTIDAAGDIILDADGGDITFKDAGTEIGHLSNSSSDFIISSAVNDKDLKFQGTDNNSVITALTLDMSEAGNASFNGSVTANAGVVVDNITIDGTEIDLSSGDLTIDVAGNIQLDADDNGEIRILDGGTQFAQIKKDGNNALFQSIVADGDFIIQGIDSSSFVSALTLDMSDAGTAIFNHDVRVGDNNFFICGAGDDVAIASDGTHGTISTGNGNFIVDCHNTIILDADDGEIQFKDAGTEVGGINMASSNFAFESKVSDKDILFKGNDGGSEITALTLDMSEAGAATFNNNVTAFSDERLKDNIETLEDGLDKVEQLRGVTYTRDGKENIGVIAQEIEKILPEIVLTADDEMGTKSVDYSRITAVLIEAVKELSARVKELESK